MKHNLPCMYIIISITAGYLWTYVFEPLTSFSSSNTSSIFYIIFSTGIPAAAYFVREGFKEYKNQCFKPPKVKKCLFYAAGGAVMWSIGTVINNAVATIMAFFGTMPIVQIEKGLSGADAVIGFISVFVTAPVFEEIFYRGVLFVKYKRYGVFGFLFVSSLYFALAHGSITIFFMPLIYGVISSAVLKKTGCLWYCVIMHAVSNLISWICQQLRPSVGAVKIITAAVAFVGICIFVYKGMDYAAEHKNEIRAGAAAFFGNIPETAVMTMVTVIYALGNYSLHFSS